MGGKAGSLERFNIYSTAMSLADDKSSVALGRVSGISREGHLGTWDCGAEHASLLLCEPSLAPWYLVQHLNSVVSSQAGLSS